MGSANVDFVARVDHLPAPGETVLAGSLSRSPGGKGANQAVAARRLGADAALLACVGEDPAGSELRAALRREGVSGHVEVCAEAPTGSALVVVQPGGDNTVTVAAGANALLSPAVVARRADLFDRVDAVLLQLEVPVSSALDAAGRARSAGARVVLNAAPLRQDAELGDLLRTVDVLVVNEEEALRLAGSPRPGAAAGFLDVAADLRRLGPAVAVVTLGRHGAVAAGAADRVAFPAPAVASVDAVGAGDAFCAGLTVALCEGFTLSDAVRFANACGALATGGVGAQASLPERRAVDDLLAREQPRAGSAPGSTGAVQF